MTEAEALKQFIPILGRISAPGERATITRNILERIAGTATSIMGVSHKHAGALAWPTDAEKSLAFETALNIAVDAGEFVSTIHRADRRHFQIEELAAWPDCPPISPESPLTFWLGDPEQDTATRAPVVQGGSVTVWTAERKEAARTMMNAQRGQGIKAFSANTAAAFGVSPTRLREVLNDNPKKAPAKRAKGVWDL